MSPEPSSSTPVSRRRFLRQAALATVTARTLAGGRAAEPGANAMDNLVIRAWDSSGAPLPAQGFATLYLTDTDRNQLPSSGFHTSDGALSVAGLRTPVVIVMTLPVAGFGTVYLFADNQGRGYPPAGELNLNLEFAASRLAAVRTRLAAAVAAGCRFGADLQERLARAEAKLTEARAAVDQPARLSARASESLADSLWAGEQVVLEAARQRLDKLRPREGFLFGCNAFGLHHGAGYTGPFERLFNFGTVPFYRASFEPAEGQPNSRGADAITAWLRGAGITPKGHPLTWFHRAGIAKWMEAKSFEQNRDSAMARCETLARQYAGRIDRWDVINEAHDWANELGYSQDQLLEMTRVSCTGTRAGNPRAEVIVNNCCVFGEYAASGQTYFRRETRPLCTPYQYLRRCLDAGLDFDVVGLQLYYPGYDMFEIDRLLDWYAGLGKPLHVTELGVSSDTVPDERSLVKQPGAAYWHAPWSETVQADWVEQFYTLCYSKSAVRAVTWWDFADAGHFWPHGGFLRPDLVPKESYHRLQRLLASWRA